MTRRALVLGAGLQGACAAFALAERGWTVVLVDQADRPLDRASRKNEGKIHLGMTYANDTSLATGRLMLQCGLEFGPLIEGWCGAVDWQAMLSAPFEYVIMRDSIVPVDRLADTYARLAEAFLEVRSDSRYLGQRLDWLVEPPVPLAGGGAVNPEVASHAARTAERALDLPAFCGIVADRLSADPAITFRPGCRVDAVERDGHGFTVGGPMAGTEGSWRERGDIVVNCLWEDRRRIDATLGLRQTRAHLYRLKYRAIGRLPAPAPRASYTMVLGRYGDVVVNPSGRHYLSWYPVCMTATSTDLAIPACWQEALAAPAEGEFSQPLASRAVSALAEVIPAVAGATVDLVDAGVVCALGDTDIDDPASGLHRRSEVGVVARDGYFSIDTGKLTCAPSFAAGLAKAVEGS